MTALKQAIFILLATTFALFFLPYVHDFLLLIVSTHQWVVSSLQVFFATGHHGLLARKVIAIVLFPAIVVGLLALVYRLFNKKNTLPYGTLIAWLVWTAVFIVVAMKA